MAELRAALRYLSQDPLLHVDMLQLLCRKEAQLLYAGTDGVLLREKRGGAYLLSAGPDAGEDLYSLLSGPALVEVHQAQGVQRICQMHALTVQMACVQCAYWMAAPPPAGDGYVFAALDDGWLSLVDQHYHTLSDMAYLQKLQRRGELFGCFCGGKLYGFAGLHDEGSMGLLHVLPEYRRQGVGAFLLAKMIALCLARGWTPYCQVETDNLASLALQRKLGMAVSSQAVYWLTPA